MKTLSVGDRIEKKGNIGTVRFLDPTSDDWVGIEWDDPSRGNSDGSVNGVTYFSCKHKNGGSFVRQPALNVGISMVKAIEDRYISANDDENQEMYLKGATGKLAKVEGVGMTKVEKESAQLSNLKQIGLREQQISFCGPPDSLSTLISNVEEVDLSKNLLSSWSEVCCIAQQLPKLKVLNLSDNVLNLDNLGNETSAFQSLHTLVLNHCSLTWQEVLNCSVLWPNVRQLHLERNVIEEITSPPSDRLACLELLNLTENSIKSWEEIRHLSAMPKLSTLIFYHCGFSSMSINSDEFQSLTHLTLNGNKFETLDVFNEINNLAALTNLNFMKNPVSYSEDSNTIQGVIIAKIKKLQVLNNSPVSQAERRSAELDYLQKYKSEWENAGGHQDPELNRLSEEFLKNHPRYMEIVEERGHPADQSTKENVSESAKKTSLELSQIKNILSVGDRIEKNGDVGTVRFIGNVPPTSGEWVGVEWDDPSRGKHNGFKDGVSYFSCKHKTGGSFVRRTVLSVEISMVEAIVDRYITPYDNKNQGMYLKDATGKLTKVEGIGMTAVQKQFEKLNNLKQMGLRDLQVSFCGSPNSLSTLIPNVEEVDLSKNLLSKWSEVCCIARQLPKLKILNLSDNVLRLDELPDETSTFKSLHILVLNHCSLTWQEVLNCSVLWPNVRQLHLERNVIEEITSPPSDRLTCLELLNLTENSIKSWEEIRHLSAMPKLSTLILNHCGFSSLSINSHEFQSLTHLTLSGNKFETLDVFNEIDNLPALMRLNFVKNPVLDLEEYHTILGVIIAKIKKLQNLNNSSINEPERRSAELDYLQKYGLEWKSAGGHQDPELNRPSEEFLKNHPRFMEIAQEYGAPADHQLIKKSTAIKENLVEVIIEAPAKPEFKPVKRRLPLSMTIGNLKLFIQKITKIEVRKQRLVYVSKDDDSYVVELHRDFETLHDVSIEPLDRIQVRKPFDFASNPRRGKPKTTHMKGTSSYLR